MASARITKKQYDAMVEAHRERPGVISHAARRAKVIHRTAKRAFEEGWPKPNWARPIKEILAEDAIAARAELYEKEEAAARRGAKLRDERDVAKLDAIHERAREAEGVRSALSTSLAMFANIGQFSAVSIEFSQAAAADLRKDILAKKVKWKDAVPFLKALSLISERAVGQLKESMEALRLHTGDPQKLLGVSFDGTNTNVDASKAAEALGEEALAKAIVDLAVGEVSPEVERFLTWQAENGTPTPTEVH